MVSESRPMSANRSAVSERTIDFTGRVRRRAARTRGRSPLRRVSVLDPRRARARPPRQAWPDGHQKGNAVVRNRIKRLLREWLRLHGWIPAGWDMVVVAKDGAAVEQLAVRDPPHRVRSAPAPAADPLARDASTASFCAPRATTMSRRRSTVWVYTIHMVVYRRTSNHTANRSLRWRQDGRARAAPATPRAQRVQLVTGRERARAGRRRAGSLETGSRGRPRVPLRRRDPRARSPRSRHDRSRTR
jgi:RNase P protein component